VALVRLFVVPSLAHRLTEAGVMRASMIGTALVFSAYPFAPNALVMLALAALLGLTLGSVQPMVMSMLHHVTPEHRHGEAMALRTMVINATGTVMPLLFGLTGAVAGAGALFWAVAALVVAGSWLPERIQR
jgi:sugar phosphate permease